MTFGQSPPFLRTSPPGPRASGLIDLLAETECPAFTARRARRAEASGAPQDPIVWARAKGSNVEDVDGNVYVDLTSGFGVAAIGHAHPRVVEAVRNQSERLLHGLGDLHPSDVKIDLLQTLCRLAPFANARGILSLSGADAVESALKTAVLATGRAGVVAFDRGYHGLSHGPLAVTGYAPAFRTPFQAQLNPHVRFAPYPAPDADVAASLAAVDLAMDDQIGAILVEPIQGRGGVHIPPAGFLEGLADLAHRHGALLIVDEILTGLGRCGVRWRSADHADLLCVGKALGGGLPVSACLGRPEVMAAWGSPDGEAIHTGTFFGHPLGCAAALAALQVLDEEGLAARARSIGERFMADLRGADFDVVGEGLMIGVRWPTAVLGVVRSLLEAGYLALPAGSDARTLQLAPPLTIDSSLLEGFVRTLGTLRP
ncbi:MAG: aspartate aminotransferase family protein [Myxococcota bacterium]